MTGRCARGHQCACIGELRGMRPGCLQWRPALSPPPVHAGEVSDGGDRGPAGAVMDALWPIMGGNHQSAEFWYEVSDAVTAALQAARDHPSSGEDVGTGWDREICTGCASSMSVESIKAGGFVSCCPDRRMVKVSDLVGAYEKRNHFGDVTTMIGEEQLSKNLGELKSGEGVETDHVADTGKMVGEDVEGLLSRLGYWSMEAGRIADESKGPGEVTSDEWGQLRDVIDQALAALSTRSQS